MRCVCAFCRFGDDCNLCKVHGRSQPLEAMEIYYWKKNYKPNVAQNESGFDVPFARSCASHCDIFEKRCDINRLCGCNCPASYISSHSAFSPQRRSNCQFLLPQIYVRPSLPLGLFLTPHPPIGKRSRCRNNSATCTRTTLHTKTCKPTCVTTCVSARRSANKVLSPLPPAPAALPFEQSHPLTLYPPLPSLQASIPHST